MAAPHADTLRVRHQSVRTSESKTQRSIARLTFFESKLHGAHFVHTAGSARVKWECNRVMQFVTQYMTWEPCGPDSTYNCPYLWNPTMDISIWDLERTAAQAATNNGVHQMLSLSSSGVPLEYNNQLDIQKFQHTQEMLKTARIIVADSTLLQSCTDCQLVALGKDMGYIIGGYGKTLLGLSQNMKRNIVAGALRHAQNTGNSKARVGYIPLQQCGSRHNYSEYGLVQAKKFQALVLAGYLVPMPSIEDFAKLYMKEQCSENFFPKKGIHYTLARQKWLSIAIILWAKAHNLSLVLCLGWNSKCLKALEEELEAQKRLVQQLAIGTRQSEIAL